ncbi:MAG: hypothetical protein R8M38_01890 [Mariprofundaceae bacterium]
MTEQALNEAPVENMPMHDYIAKQITDSPIKMDPFPHIVLTKIFPDGVFQTILKNIPDEKYFSSINDALYNSRYMLGLAPSHLATLPEDLRAIWSDIYDGLCHPIVQKALLKKLSPGLAHRFGVPEFETENIEVFPKPTLYMDKDGYGITPHPDSSKKVITMQIYLPEDDSQEELGTALYKLSLKGVMNKAARGFKKAAQFKFLPNHGYAFPVVKSLTMTSWHGREHIDSTGKRPRLSILHMYYAKEEYGPGL